MTLPPNCSFFVTDIHGTNIHSRESYDLKFIFRIGKILESRVVIQLISVISLSLSVAIIGQYSAIVDARIVEGVARTTGLGIYTRANDTLYPPRPRESLTTRVSA